MKKLLILLAAVAFASCSDTNETTPPESNTTVFAGKLTITSNTTDGLAPFETTEATFKFQQDEKQLLTLTMENMRFAATMPRPLTIVIPKLESKVGANGVVSITSTVTPIVPEIGGKPYPAFKIENFSGTTTGGELQIHFDCINPQIKVPTTGSATEPLNHRALFEGKIML